MVNVGRAVMHVKRQGRDIYVYLVSNLADDDEVLHFRGHKVELFDPLTGEYQMERLESGLVVPKKDYVLDRLANKRRLSDGEDEIEIESVNLGDVKDEAEMAKAKEKKRRSRKRLDDLL